jgi:DNA/RNA endonuclease YhcR with UshA esterase domain
LIDGAKKTLWLEESSLLDDAITERIGAAARRGVDVRFIGPLREGEDDFSEANLKQLAAAGVKVGRLPDPLVHAKVILADDVVALIGSINLTYSSMDLNRELGLVTSDAGVLQRLGGTLAADWKKAQPLQLAPTGVIPWQQAGDHVGAEVTVEGDIVRTRDTGSVNYLNFDENYGGKLSIVIFSKDAAKFPGPPAEIYLNQRVRVTGAVKEYQGAPEIVVDNPAQIEVMAGAGGNDRSLGVDVSPEAITPAAATPVAVTWQEAGQYVGQRTTVTGKVVRTYDTGKVTFLNFTDDWRGTFTVVIFPSDYDKFPSPPASLYLNQSIQVTGTIKEYEGAPEIIVASPQQIEVIVDNGASPAQTPSPSQTPTAASRTAPLQAVAPWRQAGDYVGRTATVEGVITDTYDTGKITFLNFSPKHDVFVAVVFAEDYNKFPLPPAKLYKGKKVWITGEVTDYQGTAQIVVHGPDQIEVFE